MIIIYNIYYGIYSYILLISNLKFIISPIELLLLQNVYVLIYFLFCELVTQSSHSPELEFELIVNFTHFFNPHCLSVPMSCRPLNAFCHSHCYEFNSSPYYLSFDLFAIVSLSVIPKPGCVSESPAEFCKNKDP